ncbi:MAG: META domain-containing protein [Proteobacteria bacterium]|nr:META domain-containing protein [Pseudomonadota bacterium]
MKHLTTLVAGALALLPLGAAAEDAGQAGTRWTIVAVSGAATVNEPEIVFEEGGRVSGTSGCNRFGGEGTQAEGILTLGPLASTRMACPGGLGEQEEAIFALLAQPLQVALDLATAAVTLTAPDGGTLALQRQP